MRQEGSDAGLMVLHLRKVFWTDDGWPVTPPERYAAITQSGITADSIAGSWEHMKLHPLPEGDSKNSATSVTFHPDGTVTGGIEAEWSLENKLLSVSAGTDSLVLETRHGWDWENRRQTIIYTGFGDEGMTFWGKKNRTGWRRRE